MKERIALLREKIQTQRFLGQDPSIEISPGEELEDLLAKFQTALDLNTPLVWGDHQYYPGESLAETFFYSGVSALNLWNFGQANDRFERAGRLTHNPLLAQRITLFQSLLTLVQALFDTGPYNTQAKRRTGLSIDRKILNQAQQVLQGLDQIPPQEKQHYQQEIQRLEGLSQKLAQEDLPISILWHFVRARRSAMENEYLTALLWLVALDSYLTYHSVYVEKTEYLTHLLSETRQSLKQFLGLSLEEEQTIALPCALGSLTTPSRFWDLYDAFIPALDPLGVDVQHDIAQFRIQPFIPPPNTRTEEDDEQAS